MHIGLILAQTTVLYMHVAGIYTVMLQIIITFSFYNERVVGKGYSKNCC